MASTEATTRLPLTGSAVNRMPAACGKTIFCTTTAIRTTRWSTPFRRRYATARSVKSEAQQRLMCWRTAAAPTTFRYVSCWPANEAVGRSSAVALERTAQAAASPSLPSDRVISSARSSGMAMPSMVARISALSVRMASRSSGCRRDRRSSRSSSDGAWSITRRNASVVTQNPAGTRMPSIRDSSPRFAPLPPTSATCASPISSNSNTNRPIRTSGGSPARRSGRSQRTLGHDRGLAASPPCRDTI